RGAGDVAAGPCEPLYEPDADRVADADEDDGDGRRGALRGHGRRCAPGREHDIHLALDELSSDRGQPIVFPLRPAVLEDDVLALAVAQVAEALVEEVKRRRRPVGVRERREHADARDLARLGPGHPGCAQSAQAHDGDERPSAEERHPAACGYARGALRAMAAIASAKFTWLSSCGS